MAQDVEVRQGWFVPIPACPLSVHRYVFTFSSPPQSITSESGQESSRHYMSQALARVSFKTEKLGVEGKHRERASLRDKASTVNYEGRETRKGTVSQDPPPHPHPTAHAVAKDSLFLPITHLKPEIPQVMSRSPLQGPKWPAPSVEASVSTFGINTTFD